MATDEPRDIEDILASYVDQLNEGDRLDPDRILAEHPVHGPEILDTLESFVESTVERETNDPLGTLGDYTLRRQIGRGGMGVVYEAWENSMDRQVALKVLPAGVAADDKAFHRFMREAKTAGKLSHPNVVPVYFMGVKEQTPFYAMEYVEGETLAQILGRLRAAEGTEEEQTAILQGISRRLGSSTRTKTAAASITEEEAAPPPANRLLGTEDRNLAYYYLMAEAFAGVAEGLQHAHSKGYTSYCTSFDS